MKFAFIVCLIAHLVDFSHQNSNFRIGNTAFFREQIGLATFAEKLNAPKCDSYTVAITMEMDYQEDNILMQKYLEEECVKRGIWSETGVSEDVKCLETGVSDDVKGLKSPLEGLSEVTKTFEETIGQRYKRVDKELAYLKWLMSKEERRDNRRKNQKRMSDLLDGRMNEDMLKILLPQDMLDVDNEKLPGAYNVSVTNCTAKRIKFTICIGWKMTTNQALYKVAHEGLLGTTSFAYFDGFAAHFGEENGEKMEPFDFNDCVFSTSRYLCVKADNDNLCGVPGGTNCELKVVDAPADFEIVRSMNSFQLITTRNKTYTVNNEVHVVPRSGTIAVALKQDDTPLVEKTTTKREPLYYHVISAFGDEETHKLNAEYETLRK